MQFSELLQYLSKEENIPRVIYDPNISLPGKNCVTLGIGNSDGVCEGAVVNNQKGQEQSLSELVFDANDELIKSWSLSIADPQQTIYYLEDLSPDTCLAFIIFQAKVRGVGKDELPRNWVEYATRWEAGDVRTTGEPFSSWGCLHNALAHVYFTVDSSLNRVAPGMDATSFNGGFCACLKLLVSLLLAKADPANVPEQSHIEEYNRALTLLKYENQHYLHTINRSTTVQLRLPIQDSNRTLLIDAFLTSEQDFFGARKAFLRNDRTHPWLKSGFSLMGLHRPEIRGSGHDMVISVDPSTRVHLRDLWTALEKLEDERWEGTRPCDQPRFPDRSQANQPWYDEMGKYTLVAAPKMVGNTYGSRLEWNDVVAVIWELYNPAKTLRVRAYAPDGNLSEPSPVHKCTPMRRDISSNIQFLGLKWEGYGSESFVLCPTIKQYLAACAAGHFTDIPMLDDLPPELSFDFMELPGGFAIIHADGVLILDDWSKDEVQINEYLKEFDNALNRINAVRTTYTEITDFVNMVRDKLVKSSNISGKTLMQLNHKLAHYKLGLRNTILSTMPTSKDYNLQQFRQLLEKRWALNTQLDELYQTVDEIDNIIRAYSETRTNRVISFITIYGFPLLLFGGLFQFVFAQLPGPKWYGIHLYGFVALCISSGLGMLGLNFLMRKLYATKNHEFN